MFKNFKTTQQLKAWTAVAAISCGLATNSAASEIQSQLGEAQVKPEVTNTVFAISCSWDAYYNDKATPENTPGPADLDASTIPNMEVRSSRLPQTLSLDEGTMFEVQGPVGVRYFLSPTYGGAHPSSILTVFPDGRATQSLTINLGDDLIIQSTAGKCEVIS